ncbi:MAG: TonB-dependent receptor [Bacteroidales bacterium]|nr:TonB-dependent receptor [Bacteroidales bacterium]
MQITHNSMKRIALAVLSIIWSALAFSSYAANGSPVTVSGTVVDEGGVPVTGALVFTDDAASSTMTDLDGAFSLAAESGARLTVSCIGYLSYNFTNAGQKDLVITLMSDMQNLEESVVVGYGTQKKANLTGAISNVSNKTIAATQTTGIAGKLQGKVSGLNIRNNSGIPGEYDININVRGFGAPLYVIDGINRTAADFHRLNSEDIESISVLKDASAAIYGLNAANGVIIVTTKAGTKSGRARFQFNANVGIAQPTDRVKMADGYQYYFLRNAANINAGVSEFISPEELEKWRTGEYKSTDWYGETFKKTSIRQEYSISADGGTDRVQYYFNVNYANDGGLLKSNDLGYNKWSFRSNIKAALTDGLSANFSVAGYTDKRFSPTSGMTHIWRGVVNSLPYKPVYCNNNPKYYNDVEDGQSMNPVALSKAENVGSTTNNSTSINTTINIAWNPTFCRDLEFKGTVAYDARFTDRKAVQKDWKMYTYDESTDKYIGKSWCPTPNITQGYDNIRYVTTQLQASYKHLWKDAHNFAAQFVWETRSSNRDWNSIYKEFDLYTNDQIDYAADNDKTKTGGNQVQTRNMSFIGRLNYDYKGRYLIELAARYDGSYRYDPSVRWGLFPVVSAGWRLSEENWMKNIDWLSNLKIRGSVGQIGEDVGDPFQYLAGFTTSGGGWWCYTSDSGVTTSGIATPALVNTSMTWTKSNLYDIGIDFSVLDNRLAITFDAYMKDKTGILAYKNVSFPNTYGATFPQENLNSNRTQGLELSLGWQDRAGEFFYSINGNVTLARTMNRYIEGSPVASDWDQYRNRTDYRWAGITWGYNVIGQFQNQAEIDNYALYSARDGQRYVTPGDWMYEDANHDGLINADDMRPILYAKGANPISNYGLTVSDSWRGIDFNVLLQGAAGFSTYHDLTYTTPFWQESNIPAWFMDAWHHQDPFDSSSPWVPGDLPAVRTAANGPYLNQYVSTASFLDCSYLRIKNVEIGYTIPARIMNKAHMDRLRVFFSANNLLTLCNKYVKAYDPELLAGGNDTGWNYPLMRTFTFGLNLNF